MDKWFYQHRSRELGPLSADELQYLASIAKIDADTNVRKEGTIDWIKYQQTEIFVKPISQTIRVIKPAPDSAKTMHVDSLQEIGTANVATQTDIIARLPQPAISILTEEQRRARIVSAGVVSAILVVLLLLILLWPNSNGFSEQTGDQVGHNNTSASSGAMIGDREISGDNPAGDLAVSGAETTGADSMTATPSPEQVDNPDSPSGEAAATTEPTEKMAEAEPPDASVGETTTAGSVVEAKPENNEPNPKYAISLPKKQPRTEIMPSRRTAKVDLQPSDMTARSGEQRQQALEEGGGTAESEQAVALALKWLKARQQANGSWDFREVGQDAQPGTLDSNLGATAMAMLCFLGAGNTTRTGPEKDVVEKAFDYIKSQQGQAKLGQDSMYVHALVTLCLTELAEMEPGEKDARSLAIKAIAFMESAQDPHGGGWRYHPQEPGDTSVTGWQILALQSAQSAKITVDQNVVNNANRFLDSVSDYNSGRYWYTPGSPATPCMTAVGVLCRMYLGWNQENAHMQRGLAHVVDAGVSPINMYQNYYAAMALHHAGGPQWKAWNVQMRQQLIQTQITQGRAAGSWQVTDPYGQSAGQIYQTALSVLTLEVYYRYLPLYRSKK